MSDYELPFDAQLHEIALHHGEVRSLQNAHLDSDQLSTTLSIVFERKGITVFQWRVFINVACRVLVYGT